MLKHVGCMWRTFVLVCQKFEPTFRVAKLKQKHKLQTYMLACCLGFVYTLRNGGFSHSVVPGTRHCRFVRGVVFVVPLFPFVACAMQFNVVHSFEDSLFRRRQAETPFSFAATKFIGILIF